MLLCAQGEWYFDVAAQTLYLWPNSTSAGTVGALRAAVLETVVVVNGTGAAPVTNVSFEGIGFGETAPTFLMPYERPISGDWAIHRGGTVHVRHAVGVSFARGNWSRTGGNALLFSHGVKNSRCASSTTAAIWRSLSRDLRAWSDGVSRVSCCSVSDSEFFSTGDSAVVAYGAIDFETGSALGTYTRGYPSGLTIQRNLMHEIGVWGKQTSCFFQGVSGRNDFVDNVCMNGPRAMVNINDGFLGLSRLEGNVLFNGCRESDDHGNFNSWDRTPMLHLSDDSWGEQSWTPGWSTVTRNLLVNSYGAGHGIDHDDGSMMWQDVGNVVAFSHACKGNYGSDRNCSSNLVIAPELKDAYASKASASAPCGEEVDNGRGSTFADKYFQYNTCVLIAEEAAEAYLFQSCSTDGTGAHMDGTVWGTSGNRFLVQKGAEVVIPCGGKKIPLHEWQTKYHQDRGATVGAFPTAAELTEMAMAVLK